MNYVDNNFYELTKILKQMSLNEIYESIKYSYLNLDNNVKDLYENYFEKFNYWGKLKAKNNEFEEIYEKALFLNNHIKDLEWLYEKLEDYRSKLLLYGIINNWFNYDFKTLNITKENTYKHYFDLDLVKVDEETVFVDLGAYIGDTVIDFINSYGEKNYKKIYCYEMTDLSYSLLKKNLGKYDRTVCKKKAVGETKHKAFFNENSDISANKIDIDGENEIEITSLDLDIEEEITLVKMDIEGSEMNALKGMKRHIEKEKPDLLISVYHKNEDLISIPKLINKYYDGYKFYLRSHSGDVYPTEIVLICIAE